jgi:hypothetical protein
VCSSRHHVHNNPDDRRDCYDRAMEKTKHPEHYQCDEDDCEKNRLAREKLSNPRHGPFWHERTRPNGSAFSNWTTTPSPGNGVLAVAGDSHSSASSLIAETVPDLRDAPGYTDAQTEA